MNVVHICSSSGGGGAAIGAYNLHKALLEIGVDSHMLVGTKTESHTGVVVSGGKMCQKINPLLNSIERNLFSKIFKKPEENFSWNFLRLLSLKKLNQLKPDVVHYQFGGASFFPLTKIEKIRHPLVITLRDCEAFTGGCHYNGECTRFEEGCGKCPILGSKRQKDWTRRTFSKKAKTLNRRKHPTIYVGISEWISGMARRSQFLQNAKITTVLNGIDTKQFYSIDKNIAKQALGLDVTKKHILFGAVNCTQDPRKGYDVFKSIVEKLKDLESGNQQFEIIMFGNRETVTSLHGIPVKAFGMVSSVDLIRIIYNASDLFWVLSREEAFGKTVAEACCCQTPTFALAVGGIPEIAQHTRFCRTFIASELNATIGEAGKLLESKVIDEAMEQDPSQKYLDVRRSAEEYKEIYVELLNS